MRVRGFTRCCMCRSLYSWREPVTGETWEGGIQTQDVIPNARARMSAMIELEGRPGIIPDEGQEQGRESYGRIGSLPIRLFFIILNIAQWRCVCKDWIQSGAKLKKGMGYPKAPHLTNTVCV